MINRSVADPHHGIGAVVDQHGMVIDVNVGIAILVRNGIDMQALADAVARADIAIIGDRGYESVARLKRLSALGQQLNAVNYRLSWRIELRVPVVYPGQVLEDASIGLAWMGCQQRCLGPVMSAYLASRIKHTCSSS